MTGAPDLGWGQMVAAVLLLGIPLGVSGWHRLGLERALRVAALRMGVQLVLAGLYLQFLFAKDWPLLNGVWFAIMMAAAAWSACHNSSLRWQLLLLPVGVSTAVAAGVVLVYFNTFILRLEALFEARYLVVIGGMLLGNTMSGNIIALTHFFQSARAEAGRCQFRLAAGATLSEALRPLMGESLRRALRPMIANMMTIGIVSLPGMMTGQILQGANPMQAIRYQIAIVLAILAVLALGIALALRLGMRRGFDRWGLVRAEVFVEES